MTIRSNGLKGVVSIGLAAVICGALLSCGGPVGSPEESAGNGPDLEVTPPSVSESAPVAGARFTLSATVRNAGDGASEATTLRYYRSADATISRTDMEVGTDAVAALAASGTGGESVELVAPSTPGTYYYGACVDAVAAETDATDNCSTSVKVTVQATAALPQDRQDLVVTSPTVSDGAPAAGTAFTLSVTVSNAGGEAAAPTTVRYYQSADAAITTSNTEVGTDAVAELAPSGSGSQSVELTAPPTPGKYYYGACVDAVADESDMTNNCSTSAEVTVPEPRRPDLLVTSPSVSDTRPVTGTSFTLSATVGNDGDGTAAATTVRYYRSTDATITPSDTPVGTGAVAELAAAGSASQSVDLVAPSTKGTHYYGACVDAVADESDTTNNCSASVEVSVQVVVTEPQGHPDLTVTSPSVSDGRPVTGTSFRLSATVSNDGDGPAAATTLRYYRSTDATITSSDTQVGTDAVAGLGADGSSSEYVDVTAPAAARPYYYGACVDAVTDESDATNNCSASVKVDVEAPTQPDLEVETPTVDDTSPETGATLTLSATVSNAGDGRSAATTLRYYRSADATITRSDTQVGTDSVGALAALGSSAESISLTAPATAGPYYYGACVDAVPDESDTTNNCSGSLQVDVEEPTYPDLEVDTPTVDDTSPETGATFTLSATVSNAGDGRSATTTLRYYRSTDATITRSDTQVETDSVGALAALGSSKESISLAAPSTPGPYYYGACVDAVPDESDTTDNCSAPVKVDVKESTYPDMGVGAPTVDDTSPEAGTTFTLSATVSNTGDGASAATTLRYYRSTDATITTSDAVVGTDSIAGLAAAGTSSQSVDLTASSTPGTYYYGACVDAVPEESDTTNNCSTSASVTVPEPGPDLVVVFPSVSFGGPAAGAPFTLYATVSNSGEALAAATVLRYYRSADATITTTDMQVGTDTIAELAASGRTNHSVELTAPAAGKYYYGACVDAVTDESDTANNCSRSVPVFVQERVARIEVTPDSVSFDAVGATARLTATLYDDDDNEMQATSRGWYSANPEVATVHSVTDSPRRPATSVQAIGEGTTTVTLSANGGATGTATVTVTLPVARVAVSPIELNFEALGATKTVTVRVLDENGDEDEDASFNWRTTFQACCGFEPGDTIRTLDIVKVDDGLEITAQGTGKGSIRITSPDVEPAIVLVNVDQVPESLTVSPDSVSLAVGETATLRPSVMDANGNDMPLAEDGQGGLVVYWGTSDTDVATVVGVNGGSTGATATATAVAVGTATITGRWGAADYAVTGTATITVTDSN